jgi:hypothetical protein
VAVAVVALAAACRGGGGGGGAGRGADGAAVGQFQYELRAPEVFSSPFCVAIEVSRPSGPPVRQESTYPAGTQVIEGIVPNIPTGDDYGVSLGIFKSGGCRQPLSDADWFGAARPVVVTLHRVTVVQLALVARGGGPTGSVLVRAEAVVRRRLHGEVVTRDATPVPGALCRIFDRALQVGSTTSGPAGAQVGVLDTLVSVGAETTTLRLECERAGLARTLQNALFVPDGGSPGQGTFVATVVMGPAIELVRSTAERLTFRVHVAPLQLETVDTTAGPFRRLTRMDSTVALRQGGDVISQPEVPLVSAVIAAPLQGGAEISVVPEGEPTDYDGRLYPAQPPVRDAAGIEPGTPFQTDVEPFVFEPTLYAAGQTSVKRPASVEPLEGGDGNLQVVKLHIAEVGADGSFRTWPSLLVDIRFTGGACFRALRTAPGVRFDGVDQRVEDSLSVVEAAAVNRELLATHRCPIVVRPIFYGARLVIVTPPDLQAAADSLAAHKRSRGISTQVVTTTAIAGAGALTDSALRSYLVNAYTSWFVRPRWVLLMGDAELIPTHYDPASNAWDSARNAGDQYYGQLGNNRSIPVFGIGRFPVDTLTQAQAVVDKVKAFETSPPSGILNSFYSTSTFAAQFQDDNLDGRDDRWFAETAEHIRDHQVGLSIDVERIYRAPAASNPTLWRDGGAVPAYLRKPGFPWNGSTANVIAAVNAGTSILFHRDHGWWWGWGTPQFSTMDLGSVAVTNNEYPVVFSINCASGIFDNETVDLPTNRVGAGYGPAVGSVYWAEQFLRKADGALAVIGDTRSSSTVLNNDMAKGLFDAIFPSYLTFGGSSSIRRLGDVLNAAKAYLASRGYGPADLAQEMVIYNLLGDPTVEARTRPPTSIVIGSLVLAQQRLRLRLLPPNPCLTCPPLEAVERLPLDELTVVVLDGKGEVLGRGVPASDGTVELPLLEDGVPELVWVSGGDTVPAVHKLGRTPEPIP